MKLSEIFQYCHKKLEKTSVENPTYEAGLLIKHALNLLHSSDLRADVKLSEEQTKRIFSLLEERKAGRPMAYILGYRDFYKDRFLLGPGTLIPRPDTEHLLYAAEKLKNDNFSPQTILDIGAGSGALILSTRHLFPDASLFAIDIDTTWLQKNAAHLDVSNLEIISADIFHWQNPCKFDLIFSNPPYLNDEDMNRLKKGLSENEPRRAFYGGSDGMKFYRLIAKRLSQWLKPGGVLVLEIDYKWQEVRKLFVDAGFVSIQVKKDYNALERVMLVQKMPKKV